MGNHINVMDGNRKLIGTMNIGIDAFAIVNMIAKKHTGEMLPLFSDVNAALDKVYDKCDRCEEAILLVFINDKSTFDKDDIAIFTEAIEGWPYGNDNPKKFLLFIRDLLETHEKIITEYAGTSMAMAIKEKAKG